jgi:hypothetical protein
MIATASRSIRHKAKEDNFMLRHEFLKLAKVQKNSLLSNFKRLQRMRKFYILLRFIELLSPNFAALFNSALGTGLANN